MGYYVYALVDPKNGKIFYIGRGKDNRVFQHAKEAKDTNKKSDKIDTIKGIQKAGKNVGYYLVRYNLSEEEAKNVESICIDLLGLDKLTNEQHGINSLEKTHTDKIYETLNKEIIKEIAEPTIIIKINRLFEEEMSEQELYKKTRHCWRVGETNRNKAKYDAAAKKIVIFTRVGISANKWYTTFSR